MATALQPYLLSHWAAVMARCPSWLRALVDAGQATDLLGAAAPQAFAPGVAGDYAIWWTGAADDLALALTGAGELSEARLGSDGVSWALLVDADAASSVAITGAGTPHAAAASAGLARIAKHDAGSVLEVPYLVLEQPTVRRETNTERMRALTAGLSGWLFRGQAASAPADFDEAADLLGRILDECWEQCDQRLSDWELVGDEVRPTERLAPTKGSKRRGIIMAPFAVSLEASGA